MALLHEEVTSKILEAFYGVYNELGCGFLEKAYENAMLIELARLGLSPQAQVPIKVYFRGQLVGDYIADIVVNGCVIVELKACETINKAHAAQLINYLKATAIDVGLLLNFGNKPDFERRVCETMRSDPR